MKDSPAQKKDTRAFQGVFHRGFLKFLAKVSEERCKSRKPAFMERNSVSVGSITRATIQICRVTRKR